MHLENIFFFYNLAKCWLDPRSKKLGKLTTIFLRLPYKEKKIIGSFSFLMFDETSVMSCVLSRDIIYYWLLEILSSLHSG